MANPNLTDHELAMAASELPEGAVAEILLRVPPDEPADLVRASLVHKRWRRILTDPVFLRRYREFHRAPPLLGFFHNHPPADVGTTPRFVATTRASPLPQPEFDGEEWWAMNCHHGRVLVDIGHTGDKLVVWDPITGHRHRVGRPDSLRGSTFYSPAVLCAAGSSCNHLNCHDGPFLVVGVGFADGKIQVFVYSSEAGAWTQPASIDLRGANYMGAQNGTLIRDELYFTLGWGDGILKYEVDRNRMSVLHPPEIYDQGASLVQMEDGSLGLAGSKGTRIYLWSRKKKTHRRAARWVQRRVIDFEKLLPSTKLFDTAQVIGFAEGVGVMFVGTFAGVFAIELKSVGKMKSICSGGAGQQNQWVQQYFSAGFSSVNDSIYSEIKQNSLDANTAAPPLRICEAPVFYPIVPFSCFYTPDCASRKLVLQTLAPPAIAAPELIEDVLAEILLRVPPDEPADLVRASLVQKRWRRILTDPVYLRRYREFHRVPPLLGFFHNHPPADVGTTPRFVSTTRASPLPQPEFDGEEWWAMNCHHGRVVIDIGDTGDKLVVWDPITGDRHRIGRPDSLRGSTFCAPAVLCAVGSSCNHLNCHGGPFLVVGVGFVDGAIQVFVYSSEAGAWTQPASVDARGVNYMGAQSGTLIRDEIYFNLGWGDGILKYEVDKNRLSVLDPLEVYDQGASLVQMVDGSLGLTGSKGTRIYLWSRKKETREGAAGWVQRRVIDFEKLLPSTKLFDTAQVIGFAEGVGVMFVGTFAGVFAIELKSGKMKRICEAAVFYPIVPFMCFYTPDCSSSKLALQVGKS